MVPVHGLMMLFWQAPYDGISHDVHWIMLAELVIAGIMLVFFLGALIAAIFALQTVKRIEGRVESLVDEARQKATPLINKGTELFDDLAPKVRSITTNVEQISFTARAKVDEIGITVSEINKTVNELNIKTRVQADRVDGLVTEALNTTQHVSQSIQHGIRVPVNKIAGIVNGVKAGIEHFMESSPLAARFRPKQPKPTSYETERGPVPPYDL